MKRYWWAGLAAVALAAGPGYRVVDKIKIGGANGWDYVYVDSAAQRLYVSHTAQVEVVDTATQKLVGTIPDTAGVHGIAIAADLGRGFTSNGRDNSVTIFDSKTLATIKKVPIAGKNPDAILYEPVSKRVFTFNGTSHDVTALEARTGEPGETFAVGGKPEFSQHDGKGKVWVNIEDTAEIVEIDAAKPAVTKRFSLAPCSDPTGLAIDVARRRLFAACSNKLMAVVDPDAGKVLATLPIGQGADGAAFDNGFAFASNGADGTVTVIGEQDGKYVVLETVETQRSGRTMGVDSRTHKLYVPAAESGPAPEAKEGKAKRAPLLADSFHVVVIGR
jgi:DNA-binding beta-propeller fold protein YncE